MILRSAVVRGLRARPVRGLCSQPSGPELPAQKTETEAPGQSPKASFLPEERVWEGPKPESEILKLAPDRWIMDNSFHPKVTDDIDSYKNLTDFNRMTFRYPHFNLVGRQDGRPIADTWREDLEDFKAHKHSIFDSPQDLDIFPGQYDIIIIGGGVIGTSIALQIREHVRELVTVLVVEKDPTYSRAVSTNALCGITNQFTLPENLQMAHYGADFIRNSRLHLSILDHPPPDLHFTPTGYLYLSDTTEQADIMLENQEKQTDYGAYVDVLNSHQMETRFPFLNTEDVLIGAHGVQDEGFIDPVAYLVALRGKAEFLGVRYMHAEFVDFNLETELDSSGGRDSENDAWQKVRFVIVRMPDGRERQIRVAYPIICAGHESAEITKKLLIGRPDSRGSRLIPLPIEKRKRYNFVFNCPDGPGLNFPFLIDGTGVWCRREGLGGNFVCGKYMTDEEEPDPSNLDVDYGFFEHVIWPVLAKRVKAFEKLQIVGAWAYYEDYNYFDQNPVIGKHPYYFNVLWACGFGPTAPLMGPSVGRAIFEQLDTGWMNYKTIDLGRFGWSRILNGTPLKERRIVPPPLTPLIPAAKRQAADEIE